MHRALFTALSVAVLALSGVAPAAAGTQDRARDFEQQLYQRMAGMRAARDLPPLPIANDLQERARVVTAENAQEGDGGGGWEDYSAVCCYDAQEGGLATLTVGLPISESTTLTEEEVRWFADRVFTSGLEGDTACRILAGASPREADHTAVGAAVEWRDDAWWIYYSIVVRDEDGTYDGGTASPWDGTRVTNESSCDDEVGEPGGDGAHVDPGPRPDDDAGGQSETTMLRLAGDNRIATAADIATHTHDTADTVLITRDDEYADALAGAPLGRQLGAPLLLNPTDQLHPTVADTIDTLGASHAIILGGTVAISQQVADQLTDRGLTVDRVAGASRWDTAARAAAELDGNPTRAWIVEGADPDPQRGWPDAVAAAPAAAAAGQPVLLTDTGTLPDDTADALGTLGITDVTIVGGTIAVSDTVADQIRDLGIDVTRIAGDSRYDTSAKVATTTALADHSSWTTTWLATGRNWPDALAAGPAVAASGGVLALIDGLDSNAAQTHVDALSREASGVEQVVLLGGTATISNDVADVAATLE